MEDRDWYILKKLNELKNITKVSQVLFISQPSLTKRLQEIEKEFGVKIVNRGRRGVHFTPEGEYLATNAEEIVNMLSRIKETLENMKNDVAGTLRVGASNYFTQHQLPKILKGFKDRYPSVEYQVVTGSSREIIDLLYNKQISIGFVRGGNNWPDQKLLLFEEALCIASKGKIELKDLPLLQRIDYVSDHAFKGVVDEWWFANFSQPPLIGMVVDRVDTCKEMVMNGLGYAIMPRMILNNANDLNIIELKDKGGKPILRQTWMLYYKDMLEFNVIRAFAKFMEDVNFN